MIRRVVARASSQKLSYPSPSLKQQLLEVSQLIDLVCRFPREQYVRVELIIALFPRVADIENLWRLLWLGETRVRDDGVSKAAGSSVLDAHERAEALHRLGCLNCVNLAFPDGWYLCNLSVADERTLAAVLLRILQLERTADMSRGDRPVTSQFRDVRYFGVPHGSMGDSPACWHGSDEQPWSIPDTWSEEDDAESFSSRSTYSKRSPKQAADSPPKLRKVPTFEAHFESSRLPWEGILEFRFSSSNEAHAASIRHSLAPRTLSGAPRPTASDTEAQQLLTQSYLGAL